MRISDLQYGFPMGDGESVNSYDRRFTYLSGAWPLTCYEETTYAIPIAKAHFSLTGSLNGRVWFVV
jgi:hypothetical protein